MSEFLVEITVEVPVGHPADDLTSRRAAEGIRAADLAAAGYLVRLWRPAGPGWRNIGLWQADDETHLRALIATLPMSMFMTLDVRPLGPHPSDPGASDRGGHQTTEPAEKRCLRSVSTPPRA